MDGDGGCTPIDRVNHGRSPGIRGRGQALKSEPPT